MVFSFRCKTVVWVQLGEGGPGQWTWGESAFCLESITEYCVCISIQTMYTDRVLIAAYRPGLFQSQAFYFANAHALAPLVIAYAPQGCPIGLSTERRQATSGSEKYYLCWRTF